MEDKTVELVYTLTNQQAADLLTEVSPQVKVEEHRRILMGSV